MWERDEHHVPPDSARLHQATRTRANFLDVVSQGKSIPKEASGTIVCVDGEQVGVPTRPFYWRATTSPEWRGTHETWAPSFLTKGWESGSRTRSEWGGWKACKVQQKLLTGILPRSGQVEHCLTRTKKIETSSNKRSMYDALLRSFTLHLRKNPNMHVHIIIVVRKDKDAKNWRRV